MKRTIIDLTKSNSQKKRDLMDSYLRSCIENHNTELGEVYESYSIDKAVAYNECIEIYKEHHGYVPRIVSYNRNFFTFGFQCQENNRNYIYVITPKFIYKFKF